MDASFFSTNAGKVAVNFASDKVVVTEAYITYWSLCWYALGYFITAVNAQVTFWNRSGRIRYGNIMFTTERSDRAGSSISGADGYYECRKET